jgi:hypothetical protein
LKPSPEVGFSESGFRRFPVTENAVSQDLAQVSASGGGVRVAVWRHVVKLNSLEEGGRITGGTFFPTTASMEFRVGPLKDAGHSTKEATKKTGRKIKRGTKKVVNKSSTKTVEGANQVADKTKP